MNENAFKFSVLMTIYKKEKAEYFDRALESLENQTVLPTQIVIVKDGPLNESLEDVIKIHAKKFRSSPKCWCKLNSANLSFHKLKHTGFF